MAAQALDFREFHPGKGTQKARKVILKHAEYLYVDRPLDNDHNTMKKLVKSGEILEEVEKVVGSWGKYLMSLRAVGEAISCNQDYGG